MTPDGHAEVDIDLLADYIGGALDGPDEDAVARLIADDPRWRETYDLLAPGMAEVGAGLHALGGESEPMPADVAARLDAAFAAPTPVEPAPATAAERHLHAVAGGGADRPARRRRRLRWAAPIAAAAGVLAFAGVGIDYLVDNSDTMTASSGSGDQAAPLTESQAALVTVPPQERIVTSGTDYTQPTLGGPPAIAMAQPDDAARSSREDASRRPALGADLDNDPLRRLRPSDALLACLDAIARERGGNPITVETVDYARFQGAPALIVRFVADGVTWAWATGPDCGAPGRGTDSLGTLRVG
jgi:hypothetical protein